MKTALILIISGILIGAGVSIIWRDVQKRRRGTFVSQREARFDADPEIEITISHAAAEPAARALQPTDYPPPPRQWAGLGRTPGVRTAPRCRSPTAPPRAAMVRPATRRSAPVSTTPTPRSLSAHLFINTSGDPSWSYKNKGYGAYRRLLLGGESLGWLRLELSADGQLRANVKAHKDDRADINAAAEVPAEGLTAARASDLFSQCLKPAVTYAARQTQRQRGGGERAGLGERRCARARPR